MSMIKKIALWFVTGVVVVGATAYGYAYFEALNSKSQSVNIKVNAPEDLEISVKDYFGDGSLTPIHGSAVYWVDESGKDTTAYYGENLTCTFDGTKTLYFDGFTCDEELGKAVRVEIEHKLFGIEGYTSGLKMKGLDISVFTASTSLGQYTDTKEVPVRIFLEGEDAACIRDNMVEDLDITLNFHVE